VPDYRLQPSGIYSGGSHRSWDDQDCRQQLLKQAQQTDREEERRLGLDQASNQLPEELANAQRRFERLQQAKAELEQEAQAELKAALDNHAPGQTRSP
jgi:hypothetical protein